MTDIRKSAALVATAVIALCLAAAVAKATGVVQIRLGYDALGWTGLLAFAFGKSIP